MRKLCCKGEDRSAKEALCRSLLAGDSLIFECAEWPASRLLPPMHFDRLGSGSRALVGEVQAVFAIIGGICPGVGESKQRAVSLEAAGFHDPGHGISDLSQIGGRIRHGAGEGVGRTRSSDCGAELAVDRWRWARSCQCTDGRPAGETKFLDLVVENLSGESLPARRVHHV